MKEIRTAAAHAGHSLASHTLKASRMHLHHVINCLAGPGGAGFDASYMDPCKGMGHGAIPDAAGHPALEAELHRALADAEQGTRAMTVDAVHAEARRVRTVLEHASARN